MGLEKVSNMHIKKLNNVQLELLGNRLHKIVYIKSYIKWNIIYKNWRQLI